jgi:hypothetical protein
MGFLGNADGTGVIIAIVDEGVQLNHPEYLNASGQSRVLPGACFGGYSTSVCSSANNQLGGEDAVWPTVTHGTHVAGIAAGLTTGLANNAWILPVRVCDDTGSCPGDIDGGILWASQHGAQIINLSLGGSTLTSRDISYTQSAVANGSLIVAAAGNAGNSVPTGGYLTGAALYDGIRGSMIVVGAVDNSGNITGWSQTPGNTCLAQSSGTYCMMNYFVVAPGVGIVSSVGGGGYGSLSGTSMASPYVAGVAADIKSMWPYLTMPQVANVIFGTTIDRGAPGPDPIYGMGEVDLAHALQPAGTTSVVTNGTNVTTTQSLVGNASGASVSGVMSVGLANSGLLKNVIVVDKFGRDYTADLTKGIHNIGFDASAFLMLDQLLATSGAPGTVETGFKTVSSEGYSPQLGFVTMSGLVNTVTTPATFASSGRDVVRSTMTNLAVSATPFENVGFDMGYKLRLSGRLNQYDAGASPAYSGLFLSASAVNSPYVSLTDGGNYVGATINLADGLDMRTGFSWMAPDTHQSGVPLSDQLARYDMQHRSAFDQRGANAAVMSLSWRFANWGGLGVVASQTGEYNGVLGGVTSGALNVARAANTSAIDASLRIGLGKNWLATASYGEGTTRLNLAADGLLNSASALRSRSYGIAVATSDVLGDDSFGLALTRPMHIYSGSGTVTAATDADAMGNLTIGHGLVNFTERTPETDVEMGYTKSFMEGRLSLQSDAAYQMNVGGQTGRNAATFVTRLRLSL